MSDFAQNGLICTLQRLNDWHLPLVEDALCELALKKPIALILPCHGVDLEKPALAHLVAEIAEGRPFLSEVVVSLNGITEEQQPRVAKIFATLPMATRFLWNDQPNALNGGLTGKALQCEDAGAERRRQRFNAIARLPEILEGCSR